MADSPAPDSAIVARLRRIAAPAGGLRAGHAAEDGWLAGGCARGRLHEVFALQADDSASAAGFALALALAAGALPVLWLRTTRGERQGGRLHATGLAELGLPADSLLLGLVDDEPALLRAGADAARCAGLGTVLVESWGRAPDMDLTATRRLMLAAEASGTTVLALRVGAEPTPSAAETRWGVAAVPSAALLADAPGGPAFDIEILRRRGGPSGRRWRVEWNRDARCFREAPIPGAGLPLAADRVAQGAPPAPLRRAG